MNRVSGIVTAIAASSLLVTGCGQDSSSAPDPTHTMADGTVMSGSAMPGMTSTGPARMGVTQMHRHEGPSATASMICGDEIRDAVRRNLHLATTPASLHSWRHRRYSCTYRLAGGELRLSVEDLDQAATGLAYFTRLRHRLADTAAIRGLASFGFPAFETPQGDVVFIKDHKTLWVDATRLAGTDLPSGASRQDVAYGVASAVIGCWTE